MSVCSSGLRLDLEPIRVGQRGWKGFISPSFFLFLSENVLLSLYNLGVAENRLAAPGIASNSEASLITLKIPPP